MKAEKAFLLCLSLAVSAPALAIYKCESEGKTSYSDSPCPDGKILEVNTTPLGDPGEAGRHAVQEKSQLTRLEKERHKREAIEAREQKSAARAGAARQKKCATLALRQKRAHEAVRSSVGKANARARLKVQHITEEYEAECGRWPERELSLAR